MTHVFLEHTCHMMFIIRSVCYVTYKSSGCLCFPTERASSLGQDLQKIPFKDRSWLGYKTRSRDALLSRHQGIDIAQLQLVTHMASTHSGEMWRGLWQGNDIVAKVLGMRECTVRNSRDFQEEYPRLR